MHTSRWIWSALAFALAIVDAGAGTRRPEPDVFGYTAAFEAARVRLGEIDAAELARRHAPAGWLERIAFDPAQAKYFGVIQAAGRGRNLSLREPELATLRRNGFVVSERLGGPSFAQSFYEVYQRDLPVFVSSDAILHAWHRTFDRVLAELEETSLAGEVTGLVERMLRAVGEARGEAKAGPLVTGLDDAELYLAVALELASGQESHTARAHEVAAACLALEPRKLELFGRVRDVDGSQFKPRGHYEKSEVLQRYFRAMTWLGRIELELQEPRELAAAAALHDLLARSGQVLAWQRLDALLRAFVGRADALTFRQLDDALVRARLASAAAITDDAALAALEAGVEASAAGIQHVRSAALEVGDKPPRAFAFLGQRFALDAWVMSCATSRTERAGALEAAFAALGNDAVAADVASGVKVPGVATDLVAARAVVDELPASAWDESLYTRWLATLRELARPAPAGSPAALRTKAWAMKQVNTQLASWAQLRHDTILYAKSSYGSMLTCEYPAGYVEPVPAFWRRLDDLAAAAASALDTAGEITMPRREAATAALRAFAQTAARLGAIAERELKAEPLLAGDAAWLKELIEMRRVGCAGEVAYSGWYPKLFYDGTFRSGEPDRIVADVHTAPPGVAAGGVVHEAVGDADLIVLVVDSGPDRMLCAGPVLSHFELERPGTERLTDSAWEEMVGSGTAPARPAWTRDYLVPGR